MDIFEFFTSLFMLLCSIFGIICALIFTILLMINRQCQTTSNLLVFNSICAGLIVNIVYASQSIYQIISDRNDKLCVFRGFLLHETCGLLYHTFCIHAFHRFLSTIPIPQQYLQSKRLIQCTIIIQWLISFTFGLPILFNNQIIFHAGSRICQVSLTDIYGFLYLGAWIYIIPLPIIVGVYIRILFYIKQHPSPTIIRQRQQYELQIFRPIIMPCIILFIMGFPYLLFFLIVQFSHLSVPPYTQRICLMFISFGQGISMLLCLINTVDIRKGLINSYQKSKRQIHRISGIYQPIQLTPARTI